ncbi:5-formyltetrahydrofolate cyclo-ligase [Pigmentiphaga sp. NML080357]|uniref:5-formyltetrahydrofolate cyclo-ligase n=1 Tax=Pigmentiphaga sp. NML080357 TaxID=2008675 RepID=UPI000B415B2B|nr:5-formyltetrahydrofolate cyclo-ligase [Pigmentiphaga sp. NML080357]OVZ55439.1 5-formyltetrahydrofolate cyclo-ligase [Pigmentiphaga sp. NML080357]
MAARIASGKPREDRASGRAGATPRKEADPAGAPTAAALRPRLRALRAAMPAAERAEADARIAGFLQGRIHDYLASGRWGGRRVVLSAFWPIGDEPDLRPALHAWAQDDRLELALPVVLTPAAPLEFRAWTPGTAMAPGAYRIPEPQGTPARVPDIVLVPTLGYTVDGDRIGYGGGYYDRTLAALRQGGRETLALGIAYACGRLAPDVHVPEPHDMRLDEIISEEGWMAGPHAAR